MEIVWSPRGLTWSGPLFIFYINLYLYFNSFFSTRHNVQLYYCLHLRTVSYFKKYILIKKADIVPLYAYPNTLFHPIQNLILDIEVSILAGLIKYWADTSCSSSAYVSWHLLTVTQLKKSWPWVQCFKGKIIQAQTILSCLKYMLLYSFPLHKSVPILHLSVRGRLTKHSFHILLYHI